MSILRCAAAPPFVLPGPLSFACLSAFVRPASACSFPSLPQETMSYQLDFRAQLLLHLTPSQTIFPLSMATCGLCSVSTTASPSIMFTTLQSRQSKDHCNGAVSAVANGLMFQIDEDKRNSRLYSMWFSLLRHSLNPLAHHDWHLALHYHEIPSQAVFPFLRIPAVRKTEVEPAQDGAD